MLLWAEFWLLILDAPLTNFRPEVENNDEMQQIEIEGADNTLILSYCRYMCSCLEWPSKAPCPVNAAMADKAPKA
jgi:hypothetical protein